MSSARRTTHTRAADAVALAVFVCAAALLLAIAGRPLATDDVWWHLKLGSVYAEQGLSVPEDPLLHTASGQPTVPHEWLFQVLLHGVERVAGFHGLRVLHVALVAVILAWVLVSFRRVSGSLALAAAAGVAWVALSWYRLIQLRPELLSLLALLALNAALLGRRAPPGPARIAACVALLVVWANAHSLFAIGLALLLAACLGALLEAGLRRGLALPPDAVSGALARGFALTLGLGAIAAAANPRGFAQHATFFVESASGDIWRLQDDFLHWLPWAPPHDNPALPLLGWATANALLLVWLATTTYASARLWRERSAEALRGLASISLALAAAGFVAMLVAVRFHWLAFFPLLAVLRALPSSPRGAWAAAGAALLMLLALPRAVNLDGLRDELAREPGGYFATPYLDARYCGNATRFLSEAGLEGRLFHPFNLGGFLGYWLAPGLRTFIDGRLDHVPAGVLDDYLKIRQAIRMSDAATFSKRLDAYGVDVFVGTHFRGNRYHEGTWTDHLRRLRRWVPVFASQECSVYLRRNARNAENLARAAAYYARLGVPFSSEHGPDLGFAIAHARAWADAQRVTPPGFDGLRRMQREGSPDERHAAQAELARGLWRVGAFREQTALDRALVAEHPAALEPRRRLADGLLQLGQTRAALRISRPLFREHPRYSDVAALHRLIRRRARRLTGQAPLRPTKAKRRPLRAGAS